MLGKKKEAEEEGGRKKTCPSGRRLFGDWTMFAFCQDGRDYLKRPLCSKSLETIFQLWKAQEKKESREENTSIYKGPHYLGHLESNWNVSQVNV